MIRLRDTNKAHLSALIKQNESSLQDFCRLAWDYLAKGANAKLYASASEKLGISTKDLQHIIEGLVNLLMESCKLKLTVQNLRSYLTSLGFNEKQSDVVCAFYSAKQADINNALLSASVRLPTFKDLEWRTQAQVASRALPEQLTPKVLLRLKLENAEEDSVIFETDPGNLVHITKVLGQALEQANGQHANRVRRRFQT